jgi:uncharacterized protein
MHRKAQSLVVFAAALVCAGMAPLAAQAQQPTPAAVALAREVIITKGATAMTHPLAVGVIESAKNTFVPTNPNLTRELNEVAMALHKELDAKGESDAVNEMARAYASRFTEQELKDLLVFYKTPLGQKVSKEEPVAIEEGLKNAQRWADTFAETVMDRVRAEMRKKGHPL